MTPCEIELLIHYHVSGLPHPRANAPVYVKATERFLEEDLIEQNEVGFTTTERGIMHITQLYNLPLPREVTVWCDKDGDPIRERGNGQ